MSVFCEIIPKSFWNHVGVTNCEASHQLPGYSFEEGAHHGPLADARCVLQHSRRHCLLHHTWRYEDSVREVIHDVATAVPDLADPTEVPAAGRSPEEPQLRPECHTADCSTEGAVQLNLIRRVPGNIQYGSLIG